MKDNACHCYLAVTLENLSLDSLFDNSKEGNAPDYERILALIL